MYCCNHQNHHVTLEEKQGCMDSCKESYLQLCHALQISFTTVH